MWIVDFNENVWHFIVRLVISVTCGLFIARLSPLFMQEGLGPST